MIICYPDTHELLNKYAIQLSEFLVTYEWITEAYVSDFFFKDHWKRLPSSWQQALGDMSTLELSWLLDGTDLKHRKVLPLSLLSFTACTKAFAADRRCQQNFGSAFETIFRAPDKKPGKTGTESSAEEGGTSDAGNCLHKDEGSICQVSGSNKRPSCKDDCGRATETDGNVIKTSVQNVEDGDGKLHAFFRKHVKPKKQHEILNLAKVIKLLSEHTGCQAVVDVGAGLGHLSRLLSFGYHLSVTSVEAAGSHAPKANKYDREIDRELKKKLKKLAEGEVRQEDADKSNLPCHVTSMIYPDTALQDFLAIVNSQRQTDMATDKPDHHGDTYTSQKGSVKSNTVTAENSRSKHNFSMSKMDTGSEKRLPSSSTLEENHSNHDKMEASVSETLKRHQSTDCCDIEAKVAKQFNSSESNVLTTADDIKPPNVLSDENLNIDINCDTLETHSISEDKCVGYSCNKSKDINCDKTQTITVIDKVDDEKEFRDKGFILTGLHACGDLTPTFLKFFVNCEAAKGLASVGCCYMKISDDSTETAVPGYPMSQAVGSLPHHKLSYNTRELACHFADTYSQRLKDCPGHLKIHSYRAALEWLANQLCVGFKRTSIQIPSKKSDKMDFKRLNPFDAGTDIMRIQKRFDPGQWLSNSVAGLRFNLFATKSYASLGLQKLGISPDELPDDLLNKALAMTDRWKEVVGFYTVRLALAPVVETLVLLDRMFYLYQHGYNSALMPIFDSKLSPRNFVLLSWK